MNCKRLVPLTLAAVGLLSITYHLLFRPSGPEMAAGKSAAASLLPASNSLTSPDPDRGQLTAPPPGTLAIKGDSYPTLHGERRFFRRAGKVAVRLSGEQSLDALLREPAFSGYTHAQSWPHQEVHILEAPQSEVQRQLADPERSREWLRELISREDGLISMANPVLVDEESGLEMVAFADVILRLEPGVDALSFFGGEFSRTRILPGTTDQFVISLQTRDLPSLLERVRQYVDDPRVRWAEPDFIEEQRPAFIPNDPLYGDQWHLGGDTSGVIGFNRADVDAETAWDTTLGSQDIVIAIIDDGVDLAHEDLAANIYINPGEIPGDGIDNDNNGYIDDVNGWDFTNNNNDPNPGPISPFSGGSLDHGTAVAGVAAARGNNGIGVSGMAPRCRILPIVLANTNSGQATMYRYCAGLTGGGWRGADIINMSYGSGQSQAEDDALMDAARFGRQGRGTVLMAASGNSASAWLTVEKELAAGTYNFEWQLIQESIFGESIVWLDNVEFFDPNGSLIIPEYGFDGFGDGAPGYTSGGLENWMFYYGTERATGILDSASVRSGSIDPGHVSNLYYTKTLNQPALFRFKVWVETVFFDEFRFKENGTPVVTINGSPIIGQGYNSSHSFTTSNGYTVRFSGSPYRIAPSYPANNRHVMAIGASTDYDLRSAYSQYGEDLDMVAPSSGGDLGITTTDRTGGVGYSPNNYASFRTDSGFGGTSSACPLAAGVAALVLSVDPWLTYPQVRELLRGTADKIGNEPYVGGFNDFFGYGRVNAANAVAAAVRTSQPTYSQNFDTIPTGTTRLEDGSSVYASNQAPLPGTGAASISAWVSFANFTSQTADTGNDRNRGIAVLSTIGGTDPVIFDPVTDTAFCGGWDNGAGSKAWTFEADTRDFRSVSVSVELSGENLFIGPRDFKLQYQTDGATWKDVVNGDIQAGAGTPTSLTRLLPGVCDNQPNLRLRLIMTSNIGVTGGAMSGGQSILHSFEVTGVPLYTSTSVQNGELRLLQDGVPALATYVLPDLGGELRDGVEIAFDYRISPQIDIADGFSLNLGPLRDGENVGEGGFGEGLSFQFRTVDGFGQTPRHAIELDGSVLPGGVLDRAPLADDQWHNVIIRWRRLQGTGTTSPIQGMVTVAVDGEALFRDIPTTYWPDFTDNIAFAARSEGLTQNLFLDNVSVKRFAPDSYYQWFGGYPTGSTFFSDGSTSSSTKPGVVGVDSAAGETGMRLSRDTTQYATSSYVLPDMGPATRSGFEARFRFFMDAPTQPAADGFAFVFGNPSSSNGGEEGFADGLVVGLDLYNLNAYQVLVDELLIADSRGSRQPPVDGTWHEAIIRWEPYAFSASQLSLWVDDEVVFKDLDITGFRPEVSDRFGFTSRTGFYTADVLVDDVEIRPLVTSPFPLDPLKLVIKPFSSTGQLLYVRWGSVPGHDYRLETTRDYVANPDWEVLSTRTGRDGYDYSTIINNKETRPTTYIRVHREE